MSRARLAALALLVAVAAVYAPFLGWLRERFGAADGFFSHGPLVPFASAWLVWQRRRDVATASEAERAGRAGDWRGLLVVVPSLALLVGAAFVRVESLAVASLLPLLTGLAWLLLGARATRTLLLPIAFLGFALPWPMFAVAESVERLKELVVAASTAVVDAFGAGVRASGSHLVLPSGERLLVGDECSGLASLIALLALGAFLAAAARSTPAARRWLLVALALPVALLANLLRVTTLATVGRLRGSAAVERWHDASNAIVYGSALLLLLLVERALRPRDEAPRAAPATASGAAP
jgi:exosortase